MQYILAHHEQLLRQQDGQYLFADTDLASLKLGIEECIPVDEDTHLVLVKEVAGLEELELRGALSQAETMEYLRLARARQLAVWANQHRFCGRCATPLQTLELEVARQCPECGLTAYPRVSPCIIVLVTKGDKCLLAHGVRFPAGRFSTLAGFIEAGETAEHAVAREVREEVGIEINNIRYAASQAWPFPHNLMLGYYADFAEGELKPDGDEITEAGWFDAQSLPDLPPPFTIARQLIDGFLRGDHKQK